MGRSEATGSSSTPRKAARPAAKKAPAKKAAAKRAPATKKAPAKKAAAARKAPAKKAAAKKAPASKQAARGGSSSSARGGGATSQSSDKGLPLVTGAVMDLIESIDLADDPHRTALAASALSIATVIDTGAAVLATAAVSRELRETLRELVGDDGNDGDADLDGQDLDWGTPA